MGKLYSTKTLPANGNPGDFYLHKGAVYGVLPDGKLTPIDRLRDVFQSLGITTVVGPQGEPGRDGKDSTVPGPTRSCGS
jgi:hypothetical protein